MKKVRRVVSVEMTQSTEITCIVTRSDNEKWRIFFTESQKVSSFFMVTRDHLSFFITSSLCKIRGATEPCSNWSGCYNAARGTTLITARDIGTTTQSGTRDQESREVFCCVHLSVVLTFALSLCYWRMSNVVGCLEISNYQAICQNVGRHLNYNSFGRWHEELAY